MARLSEVRWLFHYDVNDENSMLIISHVLRYQEILPLSCLLLWLKSDDTVRESHYQFRERKRLAWLSKLMNCCWTALQVPCRVLHVLLHYFLLTNYAWMLCEGFYLHTLLVSAFTSEHKLVNWLMGLGWPVPAVIVTLYTALRASSGNPADTEQ